MGLANDHGFLKLVGDEFLIFVLVFVSRDFEVGSK